MGPASGSSPCNERLRRSRLRQTVEEMAADESSGASDQDDSHRTLSLAVLIVLFLIIGAERWIAVLDRPPPLLVVAVPVDDGSKAVIEPNLRLPSQPSKLFGVQTIPTVMPWAVRHRLNKGCRLVE